MTMKNTINFLLLLALVAACTSGPIMAQDNLKVGGLIGFDLDSSELYFGPTAVFDLPVNIGDATIVGNPEFSYYLTDDPPNGSSSFWMLTLNGMYPLNLDFAETHVGVGLAITHWSVSYDAVDFFSKGSGVIVDYSDSSTDIGLHAFFEAAAKSDGMQPGAKVGFVASDSSWLYVQGFLRFPI